MKRTIVGILFSLLVLDVMACPVTPLAWQKTVDQHAVAAMVGQKKNLTWIRDQNRNFIDDELEARAGTGSKVNVIVDLNRCVPPNEISETLSQFGRVSYVGKLITFVLLDNVAVADLPRLAVRPEVAMVQGRFPMFPAMDTASRAIEAHKSTEYPAASAADLGVDGTGVVIAIMGTGITSADFTQLAGKYVAGFDASNPADPGDGSTNPPDTFNYHETAMAVIAVGAAAPGHGCRDPGTAPAADCAGIAPGAKYVNVRQCNAAGCNDYSKAADWVGVNAQKFKIGVVNMSFTSCADDDGTSAEAEQANYLASLGMVVVAAAPRATNPNCTSPPAIGGRLVNAPGSGSFVLAVNGSDDKGSVVRSDDSIWSTFTTGPRKDFNLTNPNPLALKPDLSAPATNLTIYKSGASIIAGIAGTSPATAIVSGAAALVLQKFPLMPPDSVKQFLIANADSSRNVPYNGTTGAWDSALGGGIINVGGALNAARTSGSDVTFPTCDVGGAAGQPCPLTNGAPAWDNEVDLWTDSPPRENIANVINVMVKNSGPNDATIMVNFGIAVFGAGITFYHVGTQTVTLPAGSPPMKVSQPWTPLSAGHQCAQISIAYGLDTNYANNMTQRNMQVNASVYHAQVNNAFFVPAKFELRAKSERAGWSCQVATPTFDLDPFADCPRDVKITFNAPPGTPAGQRAKCQVGVYAQPAGGEKRLVGGVTVETFVPEACTLYGQVVDPAGRPVSRARVAFAPDLGEEKHPGVVPVSTTTHADGVFSLRIVPDVLQNVTVTGPNGAKGTLTMRPACGLSLSRLVLRKDGMKLDSTPQVVAVPAVAVSTSTTGK